MGIFDRFRSSEAEFLVGSAKQIDTREAVDNAKARKAEEWQDDGFRFYDEIPHLWFAFNYLGNVMRRARIFPAVQPDPMQPPVPLQSSDGAIFQRATIELDRLRGPDGTHGELLHDMTMQLSIPGEGYLLGTVKDGVEEFDVKSIREFRYDQNDQVWKVYSGPKDRDGTPVADSDYHARFWRQHPEWSDQPDSGMRPARSACKDLLHLQRLMSGATKSRMNAGLILVPSEASFKRTDGVTGAEQGQAAARDPFLNMLMTALMTPIEDDDSASVVVPGLVKMKGDLIEKVKHLTFAREFDKVAAAREEELLSRIATSVDMPNDFVLGMADLPHWTAWFVDQDKFDAHLAPLLQLICAGITEAFLNAALGDVQSEEQVIVWYDGSAIISHPNRSSDADSAHDRLAISDAAYRRYKGYTEEDAPTPEEIEERLRIAREKNATAPGVTDDGGAPSGVNDTEAGPASDETNPANASITAAGDARGRALGEELRRLDTDLRLKLQASAQGVVFRALENAGARMRTRVGNHLTYGPLIKDVPNARVCHVLGADVVRKFQTDEELVEDSLQPIVPVYVGWVGRTQRQVRTMAGEFGEVDDKVQQEQAADRDRGLLTLMAGLTALVHGELFNPSTTATPELGEFSDVLVPPSIIRDSLIDAGGGNSASVLGLDDAPQGGVATGTTSTDVFISVGLTPAAWVWVYGDAGDRGTPFPAHEDLEGQEFLDWQDGVLSVRDEDSWLGVSHYHPGDHRWCQCDFAQVFRTSEEE